jgi:uncharacterized protein YjbI with pentapeptide repeats
MIGFKRAALVAISSLLLCTAFAALTTQQADARARGAARKQTPADAPQAGARTPILFSKPLKCPFCDLRNAPFANQNLADANLQRADLTGADLRGADLSGAILDGAIMKNANLAGAKFNTSRRGRASLSGADLTGANLRGASFNGTNLQHVDLSGIDRSTVDLSKALIVDPSALVGEKVTCGSASMSGLQTRIYVSTSGSDGSDCGDTVAKACASIAAGISRCSGKGACGVLVMHGQYKLSATIALADGVNVYGGCVATPVANAVIQSLVIAPPNGQPAMSASRLTKETVLQGFRLEGTTAPAGAASTTLLVTNSSKLSVVDSFILSGAGGSVGGPGGPGSTGAKGTDGNGETAGTNAQCSSSAGGNGSGYYQVKITVYFASYGWDASCTSPGCAGSRSPMGAAGGRWGTPNNRECAASRGDTGHNGDNGGDAGCGGKGVVSSNTSGSFSAGIWNGSTGGTGGGGGNGVGGGGGGAGGFKGGACFWVKIEQYGNPGGGGAAGGCGGGGGGGGQQGGAAFGITMVASQMTLATTTVVGGRGGNAGVGGNGGTGGNRSTGANGLTGHGGGFGGKGGSGGAGGAGAGGNGGPAVDIALVSGSTVADTGTVYYDGASGSPGGFGVGGTPVLAGLCSGTNGDTGVDGLIANKHTY